MRLIDADAFVTYLKSEKERQHLDKMKTEHLSVGDVIDAVIDELNGTALCGYKNTPTVDAVEVVRCKDCVYQAECAFTEWLGRNRNGFCSCGERREDD